MKIKIKDFLKFSFAAAVVIPNKIQGYHATAWRAFGNLINSVSLNPSHVINTANKAIL